jgi:uncharacterized lipoprotein YddW (UPF0748 family)
MPANLDYHGYQWALYGVFQTRRHRPGIETVMNRRQFFRVLGAGASMGGAMAGGLVASGARQRPKPRPALKNWAWMRGEVKSMDDWRRKLADMRAAGIDAILIGGGADFYRTVIPVARQEGLEVHAWIFTMMRGEHVKAHPEWYAVSRNGVSTAEKPPYVDYYRFLCPARNEVRQFLIGYVRELALIDGLASVHLDYIRYPDVILPIALWPKYNLVQDKEYPEFDFCYCSVCRDRFKRRAGVDPVKLPDPAGHREWLQYRHDTITEVVGLLADEVHAHKKRVTAAVFPTPTIARALVRQDWARWKVDGVLPMVYHAFYKEDVPWIERATREGVTALRGRIPLYTGLYVPDLPPADLGRAVGYAFAGGAQGVSLFQGNTLTPAHWAEFRTAVQRAGAAGVG